MEETQNYVILVCCCGKLTPLPPSKAPGTVFELGEGISSLKQLRVGYESVLELVTRGFVPYPPPIMSDIAAIQAIDSELDGFWGGKDSSL